jgi:polyisoprenyl-teichoic acid--peptidoglycan teichoic acid transferase
MSVLPKTRRGALWRSAAAAFIVIGAVATTTAVAVLLQVKTIVQELTPGAEHINVTLPKTGAPETLLLVGSDHRAGTSYSSSNTDTMMLVRIDDSSQTINLMSIPRDLEVEGAGDVPVKLNSIYSSDGNGTNKGGDNGLLQVLKTQVFPGLEVNHVIDLNFAGFSDLVDAIGCVYSDVDHRYYNISQPGPDDYSSIDIEPGYQKLCGGNQSIKGALPFVRFRHTDSDKVRNARQQDFIRWAKDGYSTSQLLANKNKLIKIFGKHVTVDRSLASENGLIDLFDLIVNANKLTLKTIPFPENFGPCGGGSETPCYVFACPTMALCTGAADTGPPLGEPTVAEEQAYTRFITPTLTKPTVPVPPSVHPVKPRAPKISLAGLIADPGDGKSQATKLGDVGMPIYYPKLIVAGESAGYCSSLTANCDDPAEPASAYAGAYPRKYIIHTPSGTPEPAYVMTLVINSALGEFYTVQGTTWRDPPIFNGSKKIQVVHGKKLYEYYDGGAIALIAYDTRHGVYWISNTLANAIPKSQMIAMAASLVAFKG